MIRLLMEEAEVQRQWRKNGMRVTTIRMVRNLPPEVEEMKDLHW